MGELLLHGREHLTLSRPQVWPRSSQCASIVDIPNTVTMLVKLKTRDEALTAFQRRRRNRGVWS